MTATTWLTIDDVKDRTTLPHGEIMGLVASGDFPSPVEQPDGTHAWRESDIDEWIEARPRVEDIVSARNTRKHRS
ncbi:MAG: AlpA family phage regulatory protein [Hyphomicrobiaceae bacterium]|nr:AlpA family phage regulatory protein [Hyphomicrobiaceae bacterium]